LRKLRLLIFCWFFSLPILAHAVSCKVNMAKHLPDAQLPEADAALAARKFKQAVVIYQQALSKGPGNPSLHAALAEAYLAQGELSQAEAVVTAAAAQTPRSAVLETVLAEVQYYEGRPWDAQDTIGSALANDPCYPDAHVIQGQLLNLLSMHASAAKQIAIAHQLAPHNTNTLMRYAETLTPSEATATLNSYLDAEKGLDASTRKVLEQKLKNYQEGADDSQQGCTLASTASAAEIPLRPILGKTAMRAHAVGLDVQINGHESHLEVDTGAGGIILSEYAASRAGLKYSDKTQIWGIGNGGAQKANTVNVPSIRIGSLEFHNCRVTIAKRSMTNFDLDIGDGIIGLDMMSRFLVTLDYPGLKLRLDPLPSPVEATPQPALALVSSSASQPDGSLPLQDRYIAPEMKDYSTAFRVGFDFLVPADISTKEMPNGSQVKLFLLDTGALRTTISPDVASSVTRVHSDRGVEVRGLSGAITDIYSADLVTFRFAHVALVSKDVVAFNSPGIGGIQISGMIGASALRQCVVHLDFRDGLVKLDCAKDQGAGSH
jgi:tetratricopeptide (TPR) repeat protein